MTPHATIQQQELHSSRYRSTSSSLLLLPPSLYSTHTPYFNRDCKTQSLVISCVPFVLDTCICFSSGDGMLRFIPIPLCQFGKLSLLNLLRSFPWRRHERKWTSLLFGRPHKHTLHVSRDLKHKFPSTPMHGSSTYISKKNSNHKTDALVS